MGKAGRFACIFLPMAATIASLVCLVLVFLGSRDAHNSVTRDFYFFKVDASNFTANSSVPNIIPGTNIDQNLLEQFTGSASAGNISDFYQVGLWAYCDGNKTSGKSSETVSFCSKSEASYFFNITEVFGLQNTTVENDFPKALKDGLNAYQKAAHWMFVAYVIALSTTAVEILVGFFAIFSRWGSCVTTIVSSASTLFTILAAITSTVISSIVIGAFDTAFKPYGIKSSFGTKMLTVVWLAVAFSIVAGLFWLFSTCCCSGKSGMKRDGGFRRQGTIVERTPYTHEYKPLDHPFGSQAMPMNTMSGAQSHARHQSQGFEPYRAQV